MSPFDKYLYPIVIDSDNNDFAWNDGAPQTYTIPSGTYDTILDILALIDTDMGAGFEVEVSELGIVSIQGSGVWSIDWGNTDDGLETLLGASGSEFVDGSHKLTLTNQHEGGYYPGLISYGRSLARGVGRTYDSLWKPKWNEVRTIAGNGAARCVAPSSAVYDRELSYGLTHKDEIENVSTGLLAWLTGNVASTFHWYPDRSLGTVAAEGTQNTDWFLVSFLDLPTWQQEPRSPEYYTWSVSLNREPVA